jgi:hypothetical protein
LLICYWHLQICKTGYDREAFEKMGKEKADKQLKGTPLSIDDDLGDMNNKCVAQYIIMVRKMLKTLYLYKSVYEVLIGCKPH